MFQTIRRLFLTLLFLSISTSHLFAADADTESEEPVIDVMGTVADHDYFKVPKFINGGKLYLPRLIFWKDADGSTQFNAFANSKKAIESGLFEDVDHVLTPVRGEITVDMSITSHLVYFWLSMLFAVVLTIAMSSRYKKGLGRDIEPKGAFQNLFEVFFVFIRDDVVRANIEGQKADKYVPYLFTVFMGIAFMNLFGLLPWAATATADLTVTATLAVMSFFVIQFSGTKDHWEHVFWFPGVPGPIRLILTPVEILGLFTKPFALAIRLFANMLSGKIMIISILGLIFIFADFFGDIAGYSVSVLSVSLTVVLYALKTFVALLQAYIFTLLTAVFIGMAAEEHHHEEHAADHAA